ncbi:MAG TPA: TIGR01210 family radical SAM protein, partial [Thermoplasmata archaeon]
MRLGELVRDLRVDRDYNPREIISTWTEKDLLDGKVVDAWVIIFRTRGCYWAHTSGCSMCGYVNDTAVDVSEADLLHQLAS